MAVSGEISGCNCSTAASCEGWLESSNRDVNNTYCRRYLIICCVNWNLS